MDQDRGDQLIKYYDTDDDALHQAKRTFIILDKFTFALVYQSSSYTQNPSEEYRICATSLDSSIRPLCPFEIDGHIYMTMLVKNEVVENTQKKSIQKILCC